MRREGFLFMDNKMHNVSVKCQWSRLKILWCTWVKISFFLPPLIYLSAMNPHDFNQFSDEVQQAYVYRVGTYLVYCIDVAGQLLAIAF